MEIAAAPRAGAVVATLRGAVVAPRRLHARPGRPAGRLGRPAWPSPAPNGSGKSTLLARAARPGAARRGDGVARARRCGSARSTRPAGCSSAREQLLDAFSRRGARLADGGGAHAAGQVRAGRRARAAPGRRRSRRASGPGPALALLQARGVNVLVLDEPTNHLDLPAIEQLEEALAAYDGTLLLVTHDRRMLEAVATTRRLEVVERAGHAAERLGSRLRHLDRAAQDLARRPLGQGVDQPEVPRVLVGGDPLLDERRAARRPRRSRPASARPPRRPPRPARDARCRCRRPRRRPGARRAPPRSPAGTRCSRRG